MPTPVRRRRSLGGQLNHLDTAVTVALALTIGVLGVLDVVNAATVAAATLATLALLATTLAGERRQLGRVVRLLDRTARMMRHLPAQAGGALLRASTSGADVDLTDADDIAMVGVTLGRTLRNRADQIDRRLAAGARVRITLIDPATSAPAEAARRATLPDDRDIFVNRVRPTLDLLRELALTDRPGGGRLEVRLLPFVPASGMILLDAGDDTGRIHVDLYSHRPAAREPMLLVTAASAQWYRHFREEFEHLWAHGRPVDLTAGPPGRTAEAA
ncbi:hypothetical protein [Micromonospora halophytica]|uniref:Uncharacterized protein n=1 Tax=Micromonospora halophytica TaxID=47864 RepID=A0A1C5HYD6_9ACTN|nr:hypothetical protein [Micromonospora halophytica]SCG51015.1 hypothetical protein GA0070560_106261 [Micromonospora halophytica]